MRTIIAGLAALLSILFVFLGCEQVTVNAPREEVAESPHGLTSAPELQNPLSKAGQASLVIDFFEGLDYESASQTVRGTNTRSIIDGGGSFQLTLSFDAVTCKPAPGSRLKEDDGRLERLQTLLQPLRGTLGVRVDKKFNSVVVNFTYIDESGAVGDPGDEFFLTTGGGVNSIVEGPTATTVSKTGGYVRINRNGDPKDAVICSPVDYTFTASK